MNERVFDAAGVQRRAWLLHESVWQESLRKALEGGQICGEIGQRTVGALLKGIAKLLKVAPAATQKWIWQNRLFLTAPVLAHSTAD